MQLLKLILKRCPIIKIQLFHFSHLSLSDFFLLLLGKRGILLSGFALKSICVDAPVHELRRKATVWVRFGEFFFDFEAVSFFFSYRDKSGASHLVRGLLSFDYLTCLFASPSFIKQDKNEHKIICRKLVVSGDK